MSNITYRDVPLLGKYGFETGDSAYVWYGKDKANIEWVVVEDDFSPLLLFGAVDNGHTTTFKPMTQDKFYELFSVPVSKHSNSA